MPHSALAMSHSPFVTRPRRAIPATSGRGRAAVVWLMAALLTAAPAIAQTKIKPGFNLFSTEQDVEIGRQSAAEAERQLPILDSPEAVAYLNAIGKRLAAAAPGADYPYQFKIVNASDINAFALPGGFMYVNRGLIEASKSEGQLAGVMAHEMGHVALRHGTNQTSKAYLSQMGLGVLSGLFGRESETTGKVVQSVGGFGLNALFLKFSRTDEEQADIVGAQTMARAGYNPQDMVDFFEMLRAQQQRDPGKVAQFFSTHPPPADRAARIRNEMRSLTIRPTAPIGGFRQARAAIQALPAAPPAQQIAHAGTAPPTGSTDGRTGSPGQVTIEAPSSNYRTFEQRTGFFRIAVPDNWDAYEPAHGYGVTLAPRGGLVDAGTQERNLVVGMIVNHYDPIERDDDRFGSRSGSGLGPAFIERDGRLVSSTHLAAATDDLVAQILKSNRSLKVVPGSQRTDTLSGNAALSVVLAGTSATTGTEERVTVFTRELTDDDVIYALVIAPGRDYYQLARTFNHMIDSLEVNDQAVHP
ncbi:MAG TPA: M48 family metallopeptidase [Candidatus Polarisedimenticolia bacterium]|nr:M48 family metallopeptidase [Candidatus Polarisedimenticolia bacterium]